MPNLPAPTAYDETALVQGCRTGSQAAQRELFERTSGRVYSLLLQMSGNPDDAFDLTQDTYVKAFGRMAEFDGRSAVMTWLHRIAVNEALQFRRRAKAFRRKLDQMAMGQPAHGDDQNGQMALESDLEGALQELSGPDRAILLLKYSHGYDYATLAEMMGVPAGTIASRLNRARRHLRAVLQRGYAAEEQEAAAHLIQRGDLLGKSDGVAVGGE